MSQLIRHKVEGARIHDELLHNGKLITGTEHAIIGEVEIIYESKKTGRKIFTRRLEYNDLLVTGAVWISEKMNNARSSFITTPVDVQLGVHKTEELDTTVASLPNERICGIMVGKGGCGDTYNTVHKVHRTDLTVPDPIPLRVCHLSKDLKGAARNRYILRVVKGEYAYYYGKRFTIDREINVMYEDGTIVPTNVNLLRDIKGQFIKVFTKYTAELDENDIREGYKLAEGSTIHSLVNSVGLIAGYPGVATDSADKKTEIPEFFNVHTITTLNTENDELKDSEATVKYIYRLHVV